MAKYKIENLDRYLRSVGNYIEEYKSGESDFYDTLDWIEFCFNNLKKTLELNENPI